MLSGDAHLGLAFEITESVDPHSKRIGVELMATSISSGGDGRTQGLNAPALLADNPSLKFASSERGYTRHVVTHRTWQADYRVVERASVPSSPIITRKSFVIEAGRLGLEEM